MTKDNPVIMILIDAFSDDYLTNKYTPFFYSLSRRGSHYKMQPLFAYRGIEATIFSGVSTNVHKIWTEFRLNLNVNIKISKRLSIDLFIKKIIELTDKFSNDRLSLLSRIFFNRYFLNNSDMTTLIPMDMLDFFQSSQPLIYEKDALGDIPTFFDILRKNNKNFIFMSYPHTRGDDDVLNKSLKLIENQKYDFWFMKFGNLDSLGHKYGPDSVQLKNGLQKIDSAIQKIIEAFESKYDKPDFLIISDHGMVNIEKTKNIMLELEQLNLQIPDDYIYFIDSTMIRFWFFNKNSQIKILEMLNDIEEGRILKKTDLIELGIDKIGYDYGETIFVLKEGVTFLPDFFRRNIPPKGMHGFAFESRSKPMLTYFNKINKFKYNSLVQFIDIMPTLLDLLNLEIPLYCEGESLVNNSLD